MITKFNDFLKLHEAVQAQDNIKGSIVGQTTSTLSAKEGEKCTIYKNPKSLTPFKSKCRAILTADGNLFVASNDIFHVEMIKFLQDLGQIKTKFAFTNDLKKNAQLVIDENKKAYDELKKIVMLTRNNTTNEFFLSETYREHHLMNDKFTMTIINIIQKNKAKFPEMIIYQFPEQSEAQKEKHNKILGGGETKPPSYVSPFATFRNNPQTEN